MSEVDLAQALAIARRKVRGLDAVESAEGKLAAKVSASLGPPWRAQVALVKSHATVKLAQLPWKVSVHEARLALTPEHVRVEGLRGGVGESSFSHAALQLDLRTPMRVLAGSGRATLKLEQWFPWVQAQFPLEEITALSGLLDVTLNRLALRLDRPSEADFDLRAAPRGLGLAESALRSSGSTPSSGRHEPRDRHDRTNHTLECRGAHGAGGRACRGQPGGAGLGPRRDQVAPEPRC